MKHTAVITSKPVRSGKFSIPDGAVNGNGDVGAVLGNHDGGLRVHFSKCDFWLAREQDDKEGGIKTAGVLDFDIPQELYNNYYVEQRMDTGEIFCRFADGEKFAELLIFVCACENIVLFELESSVEIPCPKLKAAFGAGASKEFSDGNMQCFTREFSGDDLVFEKKLAAAFCELNSKNKRRRFAACLSTEKNAAEKCSETLKNISYESLREAHLSWWENFWSKSSFHVDDGELELNWYASQYMLAVCSRNTEFPPGLYGNFITTDEINWKGDYHLNYNYQAPFYALCSSNHVELTDCYHAPLLDFVEKGRKCAADYLGQNGIFYPVGMGPKGMFSEFSSKRWERMFLGQKSNAIHSADIMIMRWNAARDREYARDIAYPFFKEIADFWEGYLRKEDGRYVVLKDSIHEVPYFRADFNPKKYKKVINDKNSLLTLGLLRMFFKCLLDISAELDEDGDRREKWQDILDNLSDFPTFQKRFKKVFRYTERGMAWHKTNSLCIQHIYPCGQIGLGSSAEMLKIARNTFFLNDRWFDDNGTNSIFPCAARLGVDPNVIIEKLKENYRRFLLPNLLFLHRGGCLENNSTTANTLNEMALQSHEGVIRIFPVWDRRMNCRFTTLRADGAFLVSSELKDGEISFVKIYSEKGRTAKIENPYKHADVSAGGRVFRTDSRFITLETEPGMIIDIVPC